MKKLTALAAALSLASPISFVFPSTAAAGASGNANGGATAECQQGLAAFFGISQGNCVAVLGNGNDNANAICHNLQFEDPAAFAADFSSFGDCVEQTNIELGKL